MHIQEPNSPAVAASRVANKEQEHTVGKPYTLPLGSSSRSQNMSPQRVPTERFQVPAQHDQIIDSVFAGSACSHWLYVAAMCPLASSKLVVAR